MQVRLFRKNWLYLLCITLLLMRVDSAHLHLCFDGKEAPVSLHTDDMGIPHDAHELDNPHSDREIYLDSDVLVKKSGSNLAFSLAFLAALSLLWVIGIVHCATGLRIPRNRRAPITFNPVSFAFHPPSHAPPR